MTVVQFDGFIPIMDRWRPSNCVISCDAAKLTFWLVGCASSVGRGKFEWWPTPGVKFPEVVKVVVRFEKLRGIVVVSKVEIGADIAAVGSGDVVRHEVDDGA